MKENLDLKVDIIGDHLKGKSIALCVSGGIAAIETPKIARHLRRYGAEVYTYMTPTAIKIVGPMALEWATTHPVTVELSGLAEHICLHDLVLVCPATLNTCNSIFAGLANNPVTTLVASALGRRTPVFIAPTMHESLGNNPIFVKNLENTGRLGITVIEPRLSEDKAKMPRTSSITAMICRALSPSQVRDRNILITGGPTPGRIDDVRILTNIFTGKLAVEIAKEAYLRGANVRLLLGKTSLPVPSYLSVNYHRDYDEYVENVFFELSSIKYDIGVFAAAVADYIPAEVQERKIPSQGGLRSIPLKETQKVIEGVRESYPDLFMVTFKYESRVDTARLIAIAKKRLEKGYEMVVANRGEEMKPEHRAHIIGQQNLHKISVTKQGIARDLIEIVGKLISHRG